MCLLDTLILKSYDYKHSIGELTAAKAKYFSQTRMQPVNEDVITSASVCKIKLHIFLDTLIKKMCL